MAQKVQVLLTDDIDGTEATETIQFALDGVTYEIDVNDKNGKKLRAALTPYVDAGRRVGGRRSSGSGRGAVKRDYDPKAVRAWATSKKINVPARGRIPADVLEKYKAAGN